MGNTHSKRKLATADGEKEWEDRLSHVGTAVYQDLRTKHAKYHDTMWNITESAMVGSLQQTPPATTFTDESMSEKLSNTRHSDWLVDTMFDLMGKTTKWCDVMSLSPPVEDGYFFKRMKDSLQKIAETAKGKDKPIVVRMMYGFGYGHLNPAAIDCNYWREKLTEDLPEDANIELWIGAWRYFDSWNHAKIIAVDGKYVHTGGHNLWSETYLDKKPVHDVSIEMEGDVAHDAHLFANAQWEWIQDRRETLRGKFLSLFPDWVPRIFSRVNISEWPDGKAAIFAPSYDRSITMDDDGKHNDDKPSEGAVPVISVGRQAELVYSQPSDDALFSMIDSSTKIVRMSLQDLAPNPYAKLFYKWPIEIFRAMCRAMWKRGVTIQIVLSNLNGDSYTHGATINTIERRIFNEMKLMYSEVTDTDVEEIIKQEKLMISFIRHKGGNTYFREKEDEKTIEISNHAKYVIVDDICSYTGSQNLYLCDLAEWGVIIDDANITAKMLEDYWNPLWDASYNKSDCNINKIMECIKNDTDDDEDSAEFDTPSVNANEVCLMAHMKANAPRNFRFSKSK